MNTQTDENKIYFDDIAYDTKNWKESIRRLLDKREGGIDWVDKADAECEIIQFIEHLLNERQT